MGRKFLSSVLWVQPILFIGGLIFFYYKYPAFLQSKDRIMLLFGASVLITFFIWAEGLRTPSADKGIAGKEAAMYPPVAEDLLFNTPTGIVFGKYKNRYVCRDINEDGHIFLIGGSGSGKSSCNIIPSLLANQEARIFAVDIKGELSFKSTMYGDEHVRVFNPLDRSKYGYNPFFNLKEGATSQQILETMQTIAYSLISMPANVKDPFWKTSARNLLIGLSMYYYKSGTKDFVDVIDKILGRPVREAIEEAIESSNPNSAEYRALIQYLEMEDETLGGIVAEMNNHIIIFANDQAVRYAFRDNPRKINPLNLEEGYSIYLSILEEKLTAYYDVMQLIINQTLAELEKRPEYSEPIIFVMDELPRILSAGKLDKLLDGARTLRSRRVILFFATQSTEALMSAYTENEVMDLISNCPYVIVLEAKTPKTQKMICNWCGKYKARKQSWNEGANNQHVSISYEERDIVEPSDLVNLKRAEELILISPWGYNRIRKAPYYKDRFFKALAKKIKKNNESFIEKKGI